MTYSRKHDLSDSELSKRSIPWNNCLSVCSDNGSDMTGRRKGVIVFTLETQPY